MDGDSVYGIFLCITVYLNALFVFGEQETLGLRNCMKGISVSQILANSCGERVRFFYLEQLI